MDRSVIVELLVGGAWSPAKSGRQEDVTSPFDGAVVGSVPVAGAADVDAALMPRRPRADRSGGTRRPMSGCGSCCRPRRWPTSGRRRSPRRSARRPARRITEARGEASRSGELIRLAAFEGTQLYGESCRWTPTRARVSTRSGSRSGSRSGWWWPSRRSTTRRCWCCTRSLRRLAAGNAVVLKPARTTPLTALALAACFVDAGSAGRCAVGADRPRRRTRRRAGR